MIASPTHKGPNSVEIYFSKIDMQIRIDKGQIGVVVRLVTPLMFMEFMSHPRVGENLSQASTQISKNECPGSRDSKVCHTIHPIHGHRQTPRGEGNCIFEI